MSFSSMSALGKPAFANSLLIELMASSSSSELLQELLTQLSWLSPALLPSHSHPKATRPTELSLSSVILTVELSISETTCAHV